MTTNTAFAPTSGPQTPSRTAPVHSADGADLSSFYAIHAKMRRDTVRFADAIADATSPGHWSRLRHLSAWALGFAHELHVHHTLEDAYFFPDLVRRVPEAAEMIARLAADHDEVDAILERWRIVAPAMADVRQPLEPARVEMHALASRLRDLLHSHLDIEDAEVLPLITATYTDAEWDELDQRGIRHIPKRGLGFSIPWNVDALDPDRRAALVATAPFALRVILRLTAGRHRRLVAAAFG